MRRFVGLNAALLGGSALLLAAVPVGAQIVNPEWNLPNSNSTPPDNSSSTDVTAQTGGTNTPGSMTGWYMSPAPNPAFGYTNPGDRDQFYSVQPINNPGSSTGPSDLATGWSFWLQTFTYQGYASQPVTATDSGQAITPGTTYIFSSQMSFQDGTGPGEGYNATTLVNQTSPLSPNTGNLFSFLGIQWENNGVPVGSSTSNGVISDSAETDIAAGSLTYYVATSGPQNGSTPWEQYYVSAVAPAGANEALLYVGWDNGGTDGNTGGQSAFADNESFTVIPEPATLSLLTVGAFGLLARRRSARKA
jgi:PEP-CTERM motif